MYIHTRRTHRTNERRTSVVAREVHTRTRRCDGVCGVFDGPHRSSLPRTERRTGRGTSWPSVLSIVPNEGEKSDVRGVFEATHTSSFLRTERRTDRGTSRPTVLSNVPNEGEIAPLDLKWSPRLFEIRARKRLPWKVRIRASSFTRGAQTHE